MTDTTRRPPRAETVLRALNVAAIHLDWLTGHDGGPDRYALALEILDDPTTLVRTDGDRAEDAGIRSKGGHSDPTGEAATPDPKLRICGQTRNASEHRRALATSAALIACTADDMQTLASVILSYRLPTSPITLQGARTAALWCHTPPHSIEQALTTATVDPEERLELSAAVELLAAQTTELQATVANILRTAVRPPTTKPKQKPMRGCVSCARDGGHFTAIDLHNHSALDMCRVCGDYVVAEGRWLPLDAVKYRNRTGKRITTKILTEAIATENRGRGRRSA